MQYFQPSFHPFRLHVFPKYTRSTEQAKLCGTASDVNGSLIIAPLSQVCIQYPDPWRSDGRHAARRVVTPLLAQQLAEALPRGGECFLVRALNNTLFFNIK